MSTAANCDSCARIATRDAGTAPAWDAIVRTTHWDVVHAYDTSLLGWIVLVARQHVEAVADLDPSAAAELGELLRHVSAALSDELGCSKTYVMQFAEHPRHAHVHFHVVPRMPDIPADRMSTNVFGYLGVIDAERKQDAEMNALALTLRRALTTG